MNCLGAAIGLILSDYVLLLNPLGEFLAVLHELLKLESVAQTFHQLNGSLAVGLTALTDVFSLALRFVGSKVTFVLQTLGELNHVVDFVVIGIHRGEEGFVALDCVLSLLQIGWHLILKIRKQVLAGSINKLNT